MGKVIVTVTTECEGLLHTLPRGRVWELQSEEYKADPNGSGMTVGIIAIGFDGDELSGYAEAALNANDEVLSYRVE